MADLFWWAATSHIVLSIVAGMLLATLVVGYLPFGERLPIIGPYVRVARFASFLLFGLLCALLDRQSADTRSEIAQLKRDLSFAEIQISNNAATAADRERIAFASAAAAADAQSKAKTYELWLATLPRDDSDLITLDESHWLQDIKPRRAAAGSSAKAVRQPVPRLRGFGEGIFGAGG
jgi:hypothetical protein